MGDLTNTVLGIKGFIHKEKESFQMIRDIPL